jgi:hypothetical protein
MDEKGYIVLRNSIDPTDAYDCIHGDTVDYDRMANFINNEMLTTVDRHFNWETEWIKYRVSDNNNSADAGIFHRDILLQCNHTLPVFTCLTYLDTTTMEVIPGSHKNNIVFTKPERLELHSGDLLIFYSSLLHKGIFTEQLEHRRLVQVFEVCRNNSEYNYFIEKSYHVQANETYSDLMVNISKNSILNSIPSFFEYMNSAIFRYGNMNLEDVLYISSEGTRSRHTGDGAINKYIVKDDVKDLPDTHKMRFNFTCYYRQYIITLLIIFIIFYIIHRKRTSLT